MNFPYLELYFWNKYNLTIYHYATFEFFTANNELCNLTFTTIRDRYFDRATASRKLIKTTNIAKNMLKPGMVTHNLIFITNCVTPHYWKARVIR